MKDRTIAWALFALAWVTYAWFDGGAGWNQDAHFDLTRAVVERQTLYIDGYDVNTGDVARGRGGHTYINKAPAVSLLAAVPYFGLVELERLLGRSADRLAHVNAWIVTAMTCGLAGALLGPLLYLHARRTLRVGAVAALVVTCTILFGTIVFPYATMLFAHVPAALFFCVAVLALRDRPLVAGMAAALSVACFYLCAVGVAVLLVAALRTSRRHAMRFVAGATPLFVALGAYQWLCFGSIVRTAVEASAFTDRTRFLGVFGGISADALAGITISPYRGLFYASPALLLAFAGGVRMALDREHRALVVLIAAMCGAFVLAVAAFNGWDGGWAFGPRYLVPVVPLLAIPMYVAFDRAGRVGRAVWAVAIAVSVAIHFIATATDAMPSPQVQDPIGRYLLPAFVTGRIPEETRAAFPWYASTRVDPVSLPREAANAGELLFGDGTRASIVPIALVLVCGFTALLRGASSAKKLATSGTTDGHVFE